MWIKSLNKGGTINDMDIDGDCIWNNTSISNTCIICPHFSNKSIKKVSQIENVR